MSPTFSARVGRVGGPLPGVIVPSVPESDDVLDTIPSPIPLGGWVSVVLPYVSPSFPLARPTP